MDNLSVDEQRRRARIPRGEIAPREHRDPDHVRVEGVRYEVVGDEERVDREFEDELAEAARSGFDEAKRAAHRALQRNRRSMTPGTRLDVAISRVPLDGLSARRLHAVPRKSGADHNAVGPPRPGGRERELRERLALIEHHVAMVERIGDEERGLVEPIGSDGRMLATADRDRMVWEDFAGVHAEVVAREAPYLGTSARTIERARVAEAERRGVRVKPSTGEVLGQARRRAA